MSTPSKVCILAAGRGTRLTVAKEINKVLLPVDHKAVISHIIEYFPMTTEYVIAVGHESEKIKDFMALVHAGRHVTFVDVDNYDGEGSGPGHSLLCCKEHLQCPFYLMSGDSLVKSPIPGLNRNWMGTAPVGDPSQYLMLCTDECGTVTDFRDKMRDDGTPRAGFIGIAGIKDYDCFWVYLEDNDTMKVGEYQVSNGLEGLIDQGIDTFQMEWYDTGTDANYQLALKAYKQFEFLPKPDEFLYFEKDKVVKFFADPMKALNRVKRAEVLEDVTPPMLGSKPHFYAYEYVPGRRISHITKASTFEKFLKTCKNTIWKPLTLDDDQQYNFETACYRFYHDKTFKRVQDHFEQTSTCDQADIINGVEIPRLQTLFNQVPWELLSEGVAVPFHGDPQPENIIVTRNEKFSFLDWREDFGGLLTMGDLYYDLAKVYHALIISGEVIRAGQYEVCENGNFNFHIRHNLLQFKRIFEDFIQASGWQIERVRMLTALVYLNLTPLYPSEYGKLLFLLGKSLLKETQEGQWII